ncbi:MAG TPA: molecular chaperone DnaK, partial [Candidatus Latescibacteria bacterium]|nr:molecular chaperone DnaK [Candidatus Latescibacterota bacterium]
FDIDANGILNVSAKDKATGKEQSIRIEASSGLTQEEIDKMMREAREHEAEDRRRRELVEVRSRADQLVYETEKNLREMGDKLSPDVKAKVEAAVGRVREAIKGTNVNEIKSATDALTQAWHEAAAQMYRTATGTSEAGGSSGPQSGSGGKDGAVDADFEVVE